MWSDIGAVHLDSAVTSCTWTKNSLRRRHGGGTAALACVRRSKAFTVIARSAGPAVAGTCQSVIILRLLTCLFVYIGLLRV
jgi:hypothetical protein